MTTSSEPLPERRQSDDASESSGLVLILVFLAILTVLVILAG